MNGLLYQLFEPPIHSKIFDFNEFITNLNKFQLFLETIQLKFCHWNLNGLAAHKFIKLSLIEGYININSIDIICF